MASPTQKASIEEAAAYQHRRRPPHIGAIVLFVDPDMGDIYPAIVTRVLSEEARRVVLTVFQPGNTPFPARVPAELNAVIKPPVKGTWHWPEE